MASTPSPDTVLTSLAGEARPLEEWLTMFHLASVVLDPFTNESAWILKTAARILDSFRGCDARVNFVVTGTKAEAHQFLGPLTDDFLVFADPDRIFVKQLGLATLPAFVFVRSDGMVPASAEGWNAAEWRKVAGLIATTCAWTSPYIPASGDPSPFQGTPALAG
ncbi:MAG: hypothetical protein ACOYL9_13075 [Ilumatobacteraceae bacterium]